MDLFVEAFIEVIVGMKVFSFQNYVVDEDKL